MSVQGGTVGQQQQQERAGLPTPTLVLESDREYVVMQRYIDEAMMVCYKDAKRNDVPTIKLTIRATSPEGDCAWTDIWFCFGSEQAWLAALKELRGGTLRRFVTEPGAFRRLAVHQDVIICELE